MLKALFWKEWREHRLIFFLGLSIVILARISFQLFFLTPVGKEEFWMIAEDIVTVAHMLLSLVFALSLGAAPFTNEFSRGTHVFLLCQPVTRARIYWTKFSFGLVLLALLTLFSSFILPPQVFTYTFTFGTDSNIYTRFFPFIILIIYSATFLTSLLAKDFLATVVATPFVIMAGALLIFVPPFPLVLWQPKELVEVPIVYILGGILLLFLILLGFSSWHRAISRLKTPYKIVALTASTIIGVQLLMAIGFLTIFVFLIMIYNPAPQFWLEAFIILVSILSVLFILMGFLICKKAFTDARYPVKIFSIILISAISLFWATYIMTNLVATKELKSAMLTAKKVGLPLTIKEIIPPPVPDNENAALVYEEAFAIYEKLEEKYSKEWKDMSLERGVDIKKLPSDQKRRLAEIVFNDPDFARMCELVKKAVDMPSCRFNIRYEDGYDMRLPHLGNLQNILKMLAIKTNFLTEQGRYEEALKYLRIQLRFGLALDNEPIYVSQLYRSIWDYITMKVLLDIISNIPPDSVPLDFYRRLITEIELKKNNMGLRKALEGETAINTDLFEKILHGKVKPNEIFSSYGDEHFSENIYWRLYTSYLGRPMIKRDTAFFLNNMVKITYLRLKPYYEIRGEIDELEKVLGITGSWRRLFIMQMRYPVSRMILSWVKDGQKDWAVNTARFDGSKIALALKIYKAEGVEYPDYLNVLVPKILSELPIDQFTGQDFIYRKEDDGFIVYSVGRNEKDDGGVYDDKSPWLHDDLAWRTAR